MNRGTAPHRAAAAVAALVLLALAPLAPAGGCDGPALYERRTARPFDDVAFDVELEITERNFRITGRNTIGKGLRARGYENFPRMQVVHFCSLERARRILEIDPHYITRMPCRITLYQAGGEVVVSAVLLPEHHPDPRAVAFAREMNALLREIVDFATSDQ